VPGKRQHCEALVSGEENEINFSTKTQWGREAGAIAEAPERKIAIA